MDGSSYEAASGGASLTVRLLQVAGEYEAGVKRERAAVDVRLSTLRESNACLDAENRALREDLNVSNAVRTRLEADLVVAGSVGEKRTRSLEAELIRTRLELADSTSSLSLLHVRIAECISATRGIAPALLDEENAPPGSSAAAVPRSSSAAAATESLLLQLLPSGKEMTALAAAASVNSRWSVERLVASAKDGDDAALDDFLRPSGEASLEGGRVASNRVQTAMIKALRSACRAGHSSSMVRLLAAGAPVTRLLHEDDAEPVDADDVRMQGLLHLAAASGYESALRIVLNRDASVSPATPVAPIGGLSLDDPDAYGRTPLHLAAMGDHATATYILIMCGADPTLRDVQGLTPAEIAAGTTHLMTQDASSPTAYSFFLTGELTINKPSPKVAAVLANKNSLFWNAGYRANRYYNEKRYARAIEAYSTALELAPQCADPKVPRDMATLHYNRARAWYRTGSHLAAIEDCSSALKHDRTYRNALAQRAECHMSLFDFERAQRDFQALMDADPSDRQWGRRLVDARMNREMAHYGILGIARDVESSVIKRAYRALCLRWHPDKQDLSGSSVAAERMMRSNAAFRVSGGSHFTQLEPKPTLSTSHARPPPSPPPHSQRITDAYETLSDPYKRMLYDMDPRSAIPRGSESFDSFSSRERDREAEREREQLQSAAVEAGRVRAFEAKKAAAQNKYRQSLLRPTLLIVPKMSAVSLVLEPSLSPRSSAAINVPIPLPLPTVSAAASVRASASGACATAAAAAAAVDPAPRKFPVAEPISLSNTDTEDNLDDDLDSLPSLPGFIAAAAMTATTATTRPLHEAAAPGVSISGDAAGDAMDDDELLRSLEEAGGDLASLFSQEGFAARLRATASSAWDEQNLGWAERAAESLAFGGDFDDVSVDDDGLDTSLEAH